MLLRRAGITIAVVLALFVSAYAAAFLLQPKLLSVGGRAQLSQDQLDPATRSAVVNFEGELLSRSTAEAKYSGVSVNDGVLTVWVYPEMSDAEVGRLADSFGRSGARVTIRGASFRSVLVRDQYTGRVRYSSGNSTQSLRVRPAWLTSDST